jgi:threonine synthase
LRIDCSDGSSSRFGIDGYEAIAREISTEFLGLENNRIDDAFVRRLENSKLIVPIGGGDLLCGLWHGFVKLFNTGPSILGVVIRGENPLEKGFAMADPHYEVSPYLRRTLATGLATPCTSLLGELITIFSAPRSKIYAVDNKQILEIQEAYSKVAYREGEICSAFFATNPSVGLFEPTSLVAIIGYEQLLADQDENGSDVIILNTGCGPRFANEWFGVAFPE